MTGRFVSADEYVSTGQGVFGYNMYSYCENNPIKYSNKTGMFIGACSGFAAGILYYAVFDTPYLKGKTLREVLKG